MTHREQLQKLREEISALDQELIALFLRRMEISDQVAEVKRAGNIAVTDTEREKQVIDAAVQAALGRGPEAGEEAEAFMRAILELSKQRQRKAMLGAFPDPGGNIILIGMPGCGKTTLGRRVAEHLSRPFFDSDEEIEKHTGRSIPDIFASDGEDAFRAMETERIAELLKKDGIVLAVGGGAVELNAELLRGGGFVIYVERSIPSILKTLKEGGRPLLEGDAEGQLHTLYERRRGMYESICHARMVNEDGLEPALDVIFTL